MSRDQLMLAIDDLVRETFTRHLPRRHRPPDMDLTIGQLECLRAISRAGSPSMSEVSAELELQPSTVTGLVDALVLRGKVERVEDPNDRRVVRVRLTKEGIQERERHFEFRRQRMLRLLGSLDEEELVKVHEALSILHAAAASQSDDGDDCQDAE